MRKNAGSGSALNQCGSTTLMSRTNLQHHVEVAHVAEDCNRYGCQVCSIREPNLTWKLPTFLTISLGLFFWEIKTSERNINLNPSEPQLYWKKSTQCCRSGSDPNSMGVSGSVSWSGFASLDVLYRSLGIRKMQFLIKKKERKKICCIFFLSFFGHQNPGSVSSSGTGSGFTLNAVFGSLSGPGFN